MVPVKCNRLDYNYLMRLNKLSAEVWNHCVDIDKEHYVSTGKFMIMSEMQLSVKGVTSLHAKGRYYVYRKYMFARDAMFRSIKANHENSSKVKLPYRHKKFFNTGWDSQSVRVDYSKGIIKLSKPMIKSEDGTRKLQKPIQCHSKSIPQNIVEIELLYRDGLKLAIKYKEDDKEKLIQSSNVASIDLGEIHSITSIDIDGNALIITGRKLRSIKRFRNKEQAKLKGKISKCTKGSNQYRKYNRALYGLKYKADNQIKDAIHKTTKLYLDYCLEHQISKVYYGDLDSCTRNTKGKVSSKTGQKLNEWNYGLLMIQLQNKLGRYGIELVKISEAHTSQKCPSCGKLNKTNSRNYKCKCGYAQHRDIVGAINILNNNCDASLKRHTNKKYLRIA